MITTRHKEASFLLYSEYCAIGQIHYNVKVQASFWRQDIRLGGLDESDLEYHVNMTTVIAMLSNKSASKKLIAQLHQSNGALKMYFQCNQSIRCCIILPCYTHTLFYCWYMVPSLIQNNDAPLLKNTVLGSRGIQLIRRVATGLSTTEEIISSSQHLKLQSSFYHILWIIFLLSKGLVSKVSFSFEPFSLLLPILLDAQI